MCRICQHIILETRLSHLCNFAEVNVMLNFNITTKWLKKCELYAVSLTRIYKLLTLSVRNAEAKQIL